MVTGVDTEHPSSQYKLAESALIRSGKFKIIEGGKGKLTFEDILDFFSSSLDRNGERVLSDFLAVYIEIVEGMISEAAESGQNKIQTDLVIMLQHLRQAHKIMVKI